MSNHRRSSRVDTPIEQADDVDEPPPSHQTHFTYGSAERGGHGTFTLPRRPSQRSPTRRHQQFIKHEEDLSGGISVYDLSGLAPSNTQRESDLAVVHDSYPPPHSHHPSPITHVRPPLERYRQHSEEEDDHGERQRGQEALAAYESQNYRQHRNYPHQHPSLQHLSLPYTPFPESHQSVSLTPSHPGESPLFLRHPHDPRLAQSHAAATSYGASPDPNLPPTVGDLGLIQLQGLASLTPPLQPLVGFSPSGPIGSALPFTHINPNISYNHQQPGGLRFPGDHPVSFMQNPQLSILNAESFDDGSPAFRASRSLTAGRTRATAGDAARTAKKRSKAQSSDGCEPEEEEKRRSRGRPRLDANDETAKDRRRTQIRLAQRAYRNRKETAIQSLEKKVDQLKSNNEEMSKAFMKLYDFAVSKGMLESAPEFGRQLQATTEKFVTLARRTSEDGCVEDELPADQENVSDGHKSPQNSGPDKANEKSTTPDTVQQPDQVLYGGYIVGTDHFALQPTPQIQTLTAVHTTSWAQDSQALEARSIAAQAPLGYEIITEPTPDNASFPFGMSFESGLGTAGLFNSPGQLFPESPYSLLSVPSSYAYQERTFGRRLQRSTLERAYALIRMPNPPPHWIASAFGFCLLFESREKITERLANRLSVTQNETLFNWRFPFLHLGGGGTFFDDMHKETHAAGSPRSDKTRRPVGNQELQAPDRHKMDSLYGIGPWNAETEEVRDVRVDRKLRMSVPGFEGDFYDADEVEWVLQQRGVVIPPAADFVTAEIDPNDFTGEVTIGSRAFESVMDSYIANNLADERNAGMDAGGGDKGQSSNHRMPPQMTVAQPPLELVGSTTASAASSDTLTSPLNLDPNLGDDLFGLGGTVPNQSSHTEPSRRTVTVNVETLVHELGLRSVCLGRTPGIRPKDINAAFWKSLA
ncbi:BZIP family transcription factor [Colletotrichum truncatum]|uniref:BZIP family transcription factor n=1 Tax=Colletotrichum truncatum TaxID=5467 RepID=A0ACC3ZFZ9_COLTU|nr:BZIP family transcription factor [Colletotrichum truncatum]KAF6801945.1 BZIP family transcription factor [Colletotrichum truncatum]